MWENDNDHVNTDITLQCFPRDAVWISSPPGFEISEPNLEGTLRTLSLALCGPSHSAYPLVAYLCSMWNACPLSHVSEMGMINITLKVRLKQDVRTEAFKSSHELFVSTTSRTSPEMPSGLSLRLTAEARRPRLQLGSPNQTGLPTR